MWEFDPSAAKTNLASGLCEGTIRVDVYGEYTPSEGSLSVFEESPTVTGEPESVREQCPGKGWWVYLKIIIC